MLDTPVLRLRGLHAARRFKAFNRVLATEDNIALPPFRLARKLIDEGAIGELQEIYFFHNGYKHHAMAGLKMLAAAKIRQIVDRKYHGKLRQKQITFDNGVSAIMYEPRDYSDCKFLLKGSRGAIADYDYPTAALRRIGYLVDGEFYRGLTLNGEPLRPSPLDRLYLDGVHRDLHDASIMSTLKIRGLMELLVEALEERSPFQYSASEAICDNFNIQIANRLGLAVPSLTARAVAQIAQSSNEFRVYSENPGSAGLMAVGQ
jgi:hypothetical protein